MSPWWIVFTKELRETVRDRRTLLMMVVVPVLLYPVLLVVSEQILLFGQRRLESAAAPVAVVGDAPDELLALVDSSEALHLITLSQAPEEALRADAVAAVAVLGPQVEGDSTRTVALIYDATSDQSLRGRRELSSVLGAWQDTLLARRLEARGLPGSFVVPVAVADSSVARPEEVGGYTLGRILPLLLVIITLLGAFYPAIDLAAGEKERGTLETLLTAPVPAGAVVAGKFLTVALIGIVAAALNLGSMLLTFQTGVLQLASQIGLDVSLPLGSVVIIFLTLIPLAVLFGALFLGLAVRSSSFKEAQNALTPVYMLVLIPVMLPLFPGIDFTPFMALVPVAGVSFFFRDLMTGDARLVTGFLVLASTAAYAVAALVFAARAFGSEDVLFGGDGEGDDVGQHGAEPWWRVLVRRTSPGRVPDAQTAVFFVAGVAVLFFWLGITLQMRMGEQGLLVSEWLLLFVPTLLFVRLRGLDPKAALSLRRPAGAGVLGALLLGAGAMPVAWGIGWLQTFFLPIPWELLEGLQELVTAETPGRLAWLLVLLAVTPAVCEEVVFRGILLGATRTLATWRVVLLNGLVFGAFHLSFETAIRFLPTAWLGIVISWAVLRTGSIWVGSLMHLLNNGTIVLLASIPALQALFSDPDAPPPLWLMPLGALSLYAGVRILASLPAAEDGGSRFPQARHHD